MGICAHELTRWVIQPTLQRIGVTNPMACTLLLATAAQESALGSHLKAAGQRGLGIYRIHSLTHRHVWDAYLARQPELASTVRGLASQHDFLNHPHAELTTNLSYATAIAWFIYARNNDFVLPLSATPEQLARLWKRFYHPRSSVSIEDFCIHFAEVSALPNRAA
ncbi:MAG: hypothetical protein LRY66_14765 [Saccharospirillaceae bacterium]|nr:hypothetical protein [Saccharospirillaceae bacterium]MCD8532569.1 hypothetical protein [Saccharospirillaceae bacterium]